MAAAQPPPPPETAWFSRAVARLISPAVRSERAEGSIQSTHERLESTAGGAVSTVEHPGDGATGGVRHRQVLACSWRAIELCHKKCRLTQASSQNQAGINKSCNWGGGALS